MTISSKDLQSELRTRSFYSGRIDGIEGVKTRDSILNFLKANSSKVERSVLLSRSMKKKRLAAVQLIFNELGFYDDPIDGLMGPTTRYATEQWQNRQRRTHLPSRESNSNNMWPSRSQLESFYGSPGTGHTLMDLPFPMRLAWDKSQVVNRVSVHSKCSESLHRILSGILREYGYDELKRLGIDLYGGIYNNRNIRGGSVPSVHAYAAAIDLDPERNQLRWGSDRAIFARQEYSKMIDEFEKENWVSLGRERNYDWMHFQASVL